MSQITFPVILLFSFRELKGRVAFCTRDFQVWHGGFSNRVSEAGPPFLPSERWRPLFFTTVCVQALCFSNTTPQLTRSDTFLGPSLLQRVRVYKLFRGQAFDFKAG